MTRTIPFIYSSFVVPRNQNQIHENNAVKWQIPSHYELILFGGVVSLYPWWWCWGWHWSSAFLWTPLWSECRDPVTGALQRTAGGSPPLHSTSHLYRCPLWHSSLVLSEDWCPQQAGTLKVHKALYSQWLKMSRVYNIIYMIYMILDYFMIKQKNPWYITIIMIIIYIIIIIYTQVTFT